MVKKSIVAGTALLLLLGLVFGTDAYSYVATTVGKVHQTVKSSVPVEFELERARQAITDLEPEIRHNMHLIAKEEVQVAKLEKEVTRCESQLSKDRNYIFRLKQSLDGESSNIVLAKRVYTPKEVRSALKNEFEVYKTREAETDKLQKVLRARHNSLKAAREKLEAMLAAKRQLEADVANLEARMQMIEVAKTTSDFNIDDSQLARAKELVEDISTRLDVAEKLLNANVNYDRIPLEEEETEENISEQITRYFTPDAESLVAERIAE